MMKLLWPLLLSGLSFGAVAQTADPTDPAPTPQGPPAGWQLGLAAVVSDSAYAGEGSRVVPIPLVTYQSDRFYFRGITAGWTLLDLDGFTMSAIAKLRLDGFEVDDLGREELARNGVDYRLLEDRDIALDAGLGMKWSSRAGELDVELRADVTDTSGGQEISVQYGYPLRFGRSMLTPNIGVTWLSDDNANYYYGTLDDEVARGVIDYKPGSVTVPHIGVSFFRPLGAHWSVVANVKYSSLPDEIRQSPFVEPGTDGTASMFIGFSRRF